MKAPTIIGIAGQAGAGKDTAAKWFIERGYRRVGFADPLKYMLNNVFGWTMDDWEDRAWKEGTNVYGWNALGKCYGLQSPRTLAQWLGTDVVRNNFGNDAWVNLWAAQWHQSGQIPVVVADVRFQNEVDKIQKLGGQVFRIFRDPPLIEMPGTVAHSSEQTDGLKGIETVVNNNGTIDELYKTLEFLFT